MPQQPWIKWTLSKSIHDLEKSSNNTMHFPNMVNRRTKPAILRSYIGWLEDAPHWWCMIFYWRITMWCTLIFHQFVFPQQIRNNRRTENCVYFCATTTGHPRDPPWNSLKSFDWGAELRSIVTFYGACIEESRNIVLMVEDWLRRSPKILKLWKAWSKLPHNSNRSLSL